MYNFGEVGINYNSYTVSEEGKMGNPILTWERAKKTNIGAEISLISNKITITGDFFYEKRENILTNKGTIPHFIGATVTVTDGFNISGGQSRFPAYNLGEMENKGFDGDIQYRDKIGEVNFWVRGNYTFARNKIIYMDETPLP